MFGVTAALLVSSMAFGTWGAAAVLLVVGCWMFPVALRWAIRQDQIDRLDQQIGALDKAITKDDQANEVNRFMETLDATLDRILRRDSAEE